MKRIYSPLLFLTVALAWILPVTAQTSERQDHEALLGRLERAEYRRDSLSRVISVLRDEYAGMAAGAERDRDRDRVAACIVAVEMETVSAQRDCDRIVAKIAQYEIRLSKPSESAVAVDSAGAVNADLLEEPVPAGETSADLVKNGLFAGQLSAEEYKMLLEAQRDEVKAWEMAQSYKNMHADISSVCNRYAATDDEAEADGLMSRYNLLKDEMSRLEDQLSGCWSSVLGNKTYAYDLLMEKGGRADILAMAEESATAAALKADGASGVSASDVMVSYGEWKRWLAGYELLIAETNGLVAAQDSLRKVISSIKPESFKLQPVELERRYFIEYEPVKVVTPTKYNSKNPVPPVKVYDHGTVFRIRVGIFTKAPNLSAMRGITPLSYLKLENSSKAYFTGGFRTAEEASKAVAYLKRLGFRAPVVAMWHDGEYVSDYFAWRKGQVDEYNIEISGVSVLSDAVRGYIVENNPSCVFSKVGDTFVVGKFNDRNKVDSVVAGIKTLDDAITAKIVEIKKP